MKSTCLSVRALLKVSIAMATSWILLHCDVDAWSSRELSRRAWLGQQGTSILTGVSILTGYASPVIAAGPPSAVELERLQKGHARVKYLLENWNAETEICGTAVLKSKNASRRAKTEPERLERPPIPTIQHLGFEKCTFGCTKHAQLLQKALLKNL